MPHGGARRLEGVVRSSLLAKRTFTIPEALPASLMESLSSFLLFLKIFLREGKPQSRK